MEIRQLRHFIAAAEAGNLRKASEQIHITPSALSLSLKNLEDKLGVKLLIRSRKGVEMTYVGEQFLDAAHSLLRQIGDMQAALLSTQDSPAGNVRLGIPYGANNALAAPLFKLLRDEFPGIRLEIEEGNTTSLERSFDNNLIDLMICYDVVEKMDQRCEELYQEQLYFVSKYDPELDMIDEIKGSELANIPIVSSPGTHSMRRTLEQYAEGNNIVFDYQFDFQSAHASLKIVVEGLANTIAPWDLIHDHVVTKLVSARKIISPTMERRVCLVSSLRQPDSPAINAMITCIKQAIDEAMKCDKLRGKQIYNA